MYRCRYTYRFHMVNRELVISWSNLLSSLHLPGKHGFAVLQEGWGSRSGAGSLHPAQFSMIFRKLAISCRWWATSSRSSFTICIRSDMDRVRASIQVNASIGTDDGGTVSVVQFIRMMARRCQRRQSPTGPWNKIEDNTKIRLRLKIYCEKGNGLEFKWFIDDIT